MTYLYGIVTFLEEVVAFLLRKETPSVICLISSKAESNNSFLLLEFLNKAKDVGGTAEDALAATDGISINGISDSVLVIDVSFVVNELFNKLVVSLFFIDL